jgi:uncharacterized protein
MQATVVEEDAQVVGTVLDAADGTTSLLAAASSGNMNDLVLLLNGDVTLLDSQGADEETALICATRTRRYPIAHTLIDRNANLDIQAKNGWTSLLWATHNANRDLVKGLVEKKASLNLVHSGMGWNALILAAGIGETEIVKILVRHNADLDQQDNDGKTALMMAAWHGYAEIVRVLIQHGANMDIREVKNNDDALALAKSKDRLEVVKLIKSEQNWLRRRFFVIFCSEYRKSIERAAYSSFSSSEAAPTSPLGLRVVEKVLSLPQFCRIVASFI